MLKFAQRFYARLREAVEAFIEDDALGHGAAIAFYAITALVPVMFIVIKIVGALYGADAARGAMSADVQRVVGPDVARMLGQTLARAQYMHGTFWSTALSVVFLLVVASGAFGEMRSALNTIWRAQPVPMTWFYIFRTRLESLLLVFAGAVVMLASMVITAMLSASQARHAANALPATPFVLQAINFVVMWLLSGALFAAIYRVLPDRNLTWRDVLLGGIITGLLFQFGQIAIGYYLGSSQTITAYGAAGSLMALLLWIYYSAEIFLFGAELTKVFTEHRGGS